MRKKIFIEELQQNRSEIIAMGNRITNIMTCHNHCHDNSHALSTMHVNWLILKICIYSKAWEANATRCLFHVVPQPTQVNSVTTNFSVIKSCLHTGLHIWMLFLMVMLIRINRSINSLFCLTNVSNERNQKNTNANNIKNDIIQSSRHKISSSIFSTWNEIFWTNCTIINQNYIFPPLKGKIFVLNLKVHRQNFVYGRCPQQI